MARLSGLETKIKKADDKCAMAFLKVHSVMNYYKKNKMGFEVNDGKYLKFIDDNECEPYPLYIPTKDVGGSAFIR